MICHDGNPNIDPQVAPRFIRPQPLVSKLCGHTADTISRSMNFNTPTVSQYRTRPLLNNSGHCLENRTESRSGVEYATIAANLTTSNPTNAILSTSFHNRTRPISTNSGHCKENRTGSNLENEVTVLSKTTPPKPISILRQNIVRNKNVYDKHVKKHFKK